MIRLPFFSKSKNKLPIKRSDIENAFIEGFSSGLKYGLDMASEFDSQIREKIRQQAIDDAIRRMNGNKL